MTGWKTKAGGVCALISGVLYAAAGAIPRPDWKPWLEFAAIIFGAAAAGLTGVGLGHKLDKLGNK